MVYETGHVARPLFLIPTSSSLSAGASFLTLALPPTIPAGTLCCAKCLQPEMQCQKPDLLVQLLCLQAAVIHSIAELSMLLVVEVDRATEIGVFPRAEMDVGFIQNVTG